MILSQTFDIDPGRVGVVADAKDVTLFDAASIAQAEGETATLRLSWREAESLHRLIGSALRKRDANFPRGIRVVEPRLLIAPGQFRRR